MAMTVRMQGALAGATPFVVSMQYASVPATVTLKSAAAGRLIELSTDGGVEYFAPVYDKATATMLMVSVMAPVTHIRLTGDAGDAWGVL